MANTRKVLLSLHTLVADRLSQEKNKSAVVDALAAAHYGITFEGGTSASNQRQSILDSFKIDYDIPEETELAEEPTTLTTDEIPKLSVLANEPVEPTEGEAQPVITNDGFVPVVQPLDPVAPSVDQPAQLQVAEPIVEPVIEELPAIPVVEPIAPITEEPTVEPEIIESDIMVEPITEPVATPIEEVLPVIETVATPEAVDVPVEEPIVEPVTEFDAGDQVDPATGLKLCPTCKSVMVTPICLNCL